MCGGSELRRDGQGGAGGRGLVALHDVRRAEPRNQALEVSPWTDNHLTSNSSNNSA